jgi:hypothetical protein
VKYYGMRSCPWCNSGIAVKYGRYLLESFVTLHRHATDDGVNIAFSVLSSWVSQSAF